MIFASPNDKSLFCVINFLCMVPSAAAEYGRLSSAAEHFQPWLHGCHQQATAGHPSCPRCVPGRAASAASSSYPAAAGPSPPHHDDGAPRSRPHTTAQPHGGSTPQSRRTRRAQVSTVSIPFRTLPMVTGECYHGFKRKFMGSCLNLF